MDSKKYAALILFMVLFLGVALRMWGVTSESYWVDEAISIRQAQADYGTTLEMVRGDVHMPLYVSLLHFWVGLFGVSELASRSLSLIFGVLAIWMTYLLAKKLFSKKAAIIASALMSASSIMVYYSQEVRLYSLLVLLTLLSFYFFMCYAEKNDNKSLLAYCFFSLLLIYTHIFAFLILLTQNAYMLYRHNFRIRGLLKWFTGQFVLLALFMPWLPTFLKQAGQALNTAWIPTPTPGIILETFIGFFGNALNLLVFVLLLLVLVFMKRFKPSEKNKVVFLALWIAIPFATVLIYSFLFRSLYNARYMLFTLPAIFILFSLLLDKITEQKALIGYIVVGVLIVSSLTSVADQVSRIDKPDWRAVSAYMKENANENDTIFVDPFYQQDPFSYYYDTACFKEQDELACNFEKHRIVSLEWLAPCCSDSTKVTATDGRNELRYYLNESFWLISDKPELYDGNSSLFSYFSSQKGIAASKSFGDVKIYKFR